MFEEQINIKSYEANDTPEFSQYIPDISRIMGECFDNPHYVPEINGNMWIMLFTEDLLIGFLMIDSNNCIWNVSVCRNYRKKGLGRTLLELAICHAISSGNGIPKLFIDKSKEDWDKLVQMYEKLGFYTIDIDRNDIHMEYLI